MPKVELTDRYIRGLKVDQRKEYADESYRGPKPRKGLVLWANPSGNHAWLYKRMVSGHRYNLTLGTYPDLTLAQARELVDDIDDHTGTPAEAVAAILAPEEATTSGLTVRRLVNRYIEEEAEPFNRDWRNQQRTLEKELVEKYGDLQAEDLTAEHVLDIVQAALDRKAPRVAQEALKQIKGLYNWAMGKKRVRRLTVDKSAATTAMRRTAIIDIARNPAEGIIAPTYKARSYHLEGKALQAMPAKIGNSTLREDVKTILLLQMLTFSRVGEWCGAHWDEIDLRKKLWKIPASRYKTGREHTVTLPKQAIKILKAWPKQEGLLFPLPRAEHLPLTSDIIGKELNKRRKLGLKLNKDFSSHALRHSGATWLAAQHCPHEVRERLLGHVVDQAGDMSQRYQHHEFMDERREWTQKWADFLYKKTSPTKEPENGNSP